MTGPIQRYNSGVRIRSYKLVRRGPKYCVRVNGMIKSSHLEDWASSRNIEIKIKFLWENPDSWTTWDYDITFNTKVEALTFIMAHE